MELRFAPYRLRFKQPFGTAHGLRDGTDSVFVRLEDEGVQGFGEATLPPYVKEDQASVTEFLRSLGKSVDRDRIFSIDPGEHPAARAALTTAYFDLISKQECRSIEEILQLNDLPWPASKMSVITLGISDQSLVVAKLSELPNFNSLKVKLNGVDDEEILRLVLRLDPRPVLLDANQAWRSVDHALRMMDLVGQDRLIGIEQPFPVERSDLQEDLARQSGILIIADESIQTLNDVERCAGSFSGINIKLMKCGGLDEAVAMLKIAKHRGLKVMLGSMSESSLGCGAMLRLKEHAEVIDLDGPWLISNDPFYGVRLEDGEPIIDRTGRHGIGTTLNPAHAQLFGA